MSKVNLTAADGAIAYSDPSVPQSLIDAWSYTTTFAQAHARTVNPDAATEAYFDAMTKELQQLAWNVTNAGKLDYHQSAEKISPAGIVESILNPYLSAAQQKQLAGILNAIQQPDVGVHNFLDFFWNKASTSANKTNMAMGPLTVVNNASNISMIYYGFDFSATDWRSLFVEKDSADLSVTAYNLEMNLNMALYDQIKDEIIDKLAGKEKDHIKQTSLDL
ncbi:MAG: hypothetical protein JJ869_20180 [Marivita sp.]|uniref:hypothetical protein n=1 Tax=Marivita sp. TaxID=2003365 RepID=UPI001B1C4027|nr:hypothetical protein [Marivita sp.]MBO6885873.1 hypothetical protein [Marivita sp.]